MITGNGGVVLSALALLGTAALLAMALLAAAWGSVRGDARLTRRALTGGGGLLLAYLLALLGVGMVSRGRVIPAGGEKYFCELDCHLAYSVQQVRPLTPAEAEGPHRWAVVLQTRFDERTISPRRPRDAPLTPNPRFIALLDPAGGQYPPAAGGEDAAAALAVRTTPITRALRPGEAYQTVLVFDLPQGVVPAGLRLEEDGAITRLLIGHERSPLHGRVLLALPAAS
jgi:hypothetical protein